jgi:N,N'-diacetylchitobiose phosphorylase
MQYGYFDDQRNEYVITRPDTPRSWSNYLGNPRYGALLTNNAGGYSFYRSAAQGRFTRIRFNNIPSDQPGKYLYLRDQESGDFWSTSWQPVGKSQLEYASECRHGTGYSVFSADYQQIHSEVTYFVPMDCEFECWQVKVTNTGSRPRQLSGFTYVEYAGHWVVYHDQVNLQYTQYTVNMTVEDHLIDHGTNVLMPGDPFDFENHGQARHTFQAIAGAEPVGYDTDRDTFLGRYRTYANPQVVEEGRCRNSLADGDNGCGCLQIDLNLAPGESREFVVFLGIGAAATAGKQVLAQYGNVERVKQELDRLVAYWHGRLQGLQIETPDAELNSMMNTWTPYNCLITFTWSRAASLVYAGERDGLGYRDSVQDLLGVLHNIPAEAEKQLELLLTGQVSTGGAMPVVKPFGHRPGQEPPPREEEYRSDDCLWLFDAIPAYVKETGDLAFFEKVLPFADQGESTVFGHMRRAIEFNLERSGVHGLPCGLAADWNDCLKFGHNGESAFVAFQLRHALAVYQEISRLLERTDETEWASPLLEHLDQALDQWVWDGEWYLRGYRHDGLKFGSRENPEGKIFLNTQSWAVLSGHAPAEKGLQAMNAVRRHLATPVGIILVDPPFEKTDPDVVKARLMNKGMKENGGIFCHTQGWAIMAEALLGRGNLAYEYLRASLPASYNSRAEFREIEPYVFCQSTHSPRSGRFGASRLPWLTGAATWACYSTAHAVLGIQPEYEGLRIDPCLPSSWKGFKASRCFRGKFLRIVVNNEAGVERGVRQLFINGTPLEGNFIPCSLMCAENEVQVVMGAS